MNPPLSATSISTDLDNQVALLLKRSHDFNFLVSLFFKEPNKRERVRVLERGFFFLLCLPSFVKLCANYVYENDETNFILTCFLIFFFYVLCDEEEEEGEKRGERHKYNEKDTFTPIFNGEKGEVGYRGLTDGTSSRLSDTFKNTYDLS